MGWVPPVRSAIHAPDQQYGRVPDQRARCRPPRRPPAWPGAVRPPGPRPDSIRARIWFRSIWRIRPARWGGSAATHHLAPTRLAEREISGRNGDLAPGRQGGQAQPARRDALPLPGPAGPPRQPHHPPRRRRLAARVLAAGRVAARLSRAHRASTGAVHTDCPCAPHVEKVPGHSPVHADRPQKPDRPATHRNAQVGGFRSARTEGAAHEETPGHKRDLGLTMEPPVGFEPTTPALQSGALAS